MEYKKILYSVKDGIANVRLNSPQNLNAFDISMFSEFIDALHQSDEDPGVKVIVVSGEGKAFSAGGDVRAMYDSIEANDVQLDELFKKAGESSLAIKKVSKPVIASLKGAVAGAGFNIALACDFRIAAEDSKFIQAFVKLGLIPDAGGIYLLTRTIGVAKATDLIMTGRVVDAKSALEMGIVNQVVSVEELESQTLSFAQEFAQGPSLSYASMKALLYESDCKEFENYIEKEVHRQIQCSHSEDYKEGVRAFVQKRKANFQGK